MPIATIFKKAFTCEFRPCLRNKSVDEFEGDAYAGKVLIGIVTAALIRIQNGIGGWNTFAFIRQMVIGNDHVESIGSRPVERFMRANATVDANGKVVTFGHGSLKGSLLDAVTLSEAMRNMKTSLRAEQVQRSQQHGGSGRAVYVIVAINQYGFAQLNGLQQTRYGLAHPEHQAGIMKLIVGWFKETSGRLFVFTTARKKECRNCW